MDKKFKINFSSHLFFVSFGLSLYFLFYLPLELLLTEFFFVIPKINSWTNTGVLLLFLLTVNLFDWEKIINNRKKLTASLLLIAISFIFYGVYHQIKINREYLPKIYHIKPSWVIQGQLVKIEGVNFGPVWKKGKVVVDGMDFLVKDWSENRIIAETPVSSKVGSFHIFIKTKEGKLSNSRTLEFKDPGGLLKH